jgi:hypothetical protein
MRGVLPYLASVLGALRGAGIPAETAAPDSQILEGKVCSATVILSTGGPAEVPALVWDERWGWRTATSRRHPIPRDHTVPPGGKGIRYLGVGITPDPRDVLEHLRDARRGYQRLTVTP